MARSNPNLSRSASRDDLLTERDRFIRDLAAKFGYLQSSDQPQPTESSPTQPEKAEAPKPPEHSRNFVLADMDGRNPRDNRACASCIAKLTSTEIGQVNWHLTEELPCRLCMVDECKPEAYTKPFTDFLEENPTIFHTVEHFKKKLRWVGFTEACLQTGAIGSLLTHPSFHRATHGPIRFSPAANTSPPATAAPSLPSPLAKLTSPATVSAWLPGTSTP